MNRHLATIMGGLIGLSIIIAVWVFILQTHASYEATKARAAEYGAQATAETWQLQMTQTAVADAAHATSVAQTAVAASMQTATAAQAVYQQTAVAQQTAAAKQQAAVPTQLAEAQATALAAWTELPNGECLMQVPNHDATIMVQGHGAKHECSILSQGNYGDFGSYAIGPSVTDYKPMTNTVNWQDQDGYTITVHHVCRLTYPTLTMDVFDDGGLEYGSEICNNPAAYLTLPN